MDNTNWQEEQKLDTANEICNHFFSLGAVISKNDYDFVSNLIQKTKEVMIND